VTSATAQGAPALWQPLVRGATPLPQHVTMPRLSHSHTSTSGGSGRTAVASSSGAGGTVGRAINGDSTAAAQTTATRVSASTTPASTILEYANFQGISFDAERTQFGNALTPPDTQIALSPTQLIEAVNTVALVMNHDGSGQQLFDLGALWKQLPVFSGIGRSEDLSDPRIFWDAQSSRWFMSIVVFDDSLFPAGPSASGNSWIGLAVSTGSTIDPTSGSQWTLYSIQSRAKVLLDQPILGVNSDKVTASADDFDQSTTNPSLSFLESSLHTVNKSEMLSGATTLDISSVTDSAVFGYAPATSHGATTTEYVVVNDFGNPSGQTMDVIAITGVPSSSTQAVFVQHDLAVCPPDGCGTGPVTTVPPPIAQPGTQTTVDSGDDRVNNAVWQNGQLWFGGNTGGDPLGLPSQSALYVADVNTANLSMPIFDYLFSGIGSSYVYPGIDLDQAGRAYIAHSRGSSSLFMSGSAFALDPGTGALMFTGVINGGAGSGYYDCGCGNPARWGDYSGASVDPANPREVWTATEFSGATSSDHGNWSTTLNRLTVNPPTVTGVSGPHSLTTGGVTVTVTGSEFNPTSTTVIIGGTAVPGHYIDDRHVTAVTPLHAAGYVGVAAATPAGISATLPNAYLYVEAPAHTGYWMVAADGGIFPFGSAVNHSYGSTGSIRLNLPIVGMSATRDSNGYWLVAADGGIFPFGDARQHSYGSTGNMRLNQPIVGMAPTASDNGYWLVAADGGVFPFGDALQHSYGSLGATRIPAPIISLVPTLSGNGYYMVGLDGAVYTFGDAAQHWYGDTRHVPLNQPIVGMSLTADGLGYWLVAADGGIFPFGEASQHSYGGTGAIRLNRPIVGMAQTGSDSGYWLVASDGGLFPFGDGLTHSYGSLGNVRLNQPVVGMAACACP
jgi:hypothetical protein